MPKTPRFTVFGVLKGVWITIRSLFHLLVLAIFAVVGIACLIRSTALFVSSFIVDESQMATDRPRRDTWASDSAYRY